MEKQLTEKQLMVFAVRASEIGHNDKGDITTINGTGLDLSLAYDQMQEAFMKLGRTNRHDVAVLLWSINYLYRWTTSDSKNPQHLDAWDRNLIEQLRPRGFSYDDIAFILSRSKASVFEYCKTIFPDSSTLLQ
jgi:hypothetical protein